MLKQHQQASAATVCRAYTYAYDLLYMSISYISICMYTQASLATLRRAYTYVHNLLYMFLIHIYIISCTCVTTCIYTKTS